MKTSNKLTDTYIPQILKPFFGLSLLSLFILNSCSKKKEEEKVQMPECIETRIKTIGDEECNNGYSVKEYIFQGKTVFVFIPGFCGMLQEAHVMDATCNSLGYLGSASGTKINGEEFSNAVFVRTVWSRN